jgi:hypothetical protein
VLLSTLIERAHAPAEEVEALDRARAALSAEDREAAGMLRPLPFDERTHQALQVRPRAPRQRLPGRACPCLWVGTHTSACCACCSAAIALLTAIVGAAAGGAEAAVRCVHARAEAAGAV